ncbi:MAG: cbb3-type cytochrome c oxidase subunit III [Arcticibacterium sp.]
MKFLPFEEKKAQLPLTLLVMITRIKSEMKKKINTHLWKYSNNLNLITIASTFAFIISVTACSENNEKPYLLGSGYGINSATLFVDDLDATRNYLRDTLGFTISNKMEKGTFDGSIVSSISFADLSSLEILSLNDSISEEAKPPFISSFLKKQEGLRLYALSSSSTDSTSFWLKNKGFKMDSIQSLRTSDEEPKGWSWDDGSPQIRNLDFKSTNPPAHLPRFVEYADFDYKAAQEEWKTYYSYGRRYQEHANGVVGTAAIRIAVKDMKTARTEFKKMGFAELETNDSLSRYKLFRNQEIHLIAPKKPDDELSDFLASRGLAVFALRFEVINLDSTYKYLKERLPAKALIIEGLPKRLKVLKEYAHGVQMEFVEESEEQGAMAKMLRPDADLDSAAVQNAAGMFKKYCALCHGENREGYAADNAPSLSSHSLLATSKTSNFMRYTIQFGRAGTAMAGYLKREGGPLEYIEIEMIMQWLYQTSGVKQPIEVSREPVMGNISLGATIYAKNCSTCHGKNGEGISAPALGNPILLATATDHFLRYAISEGRDNTPMKAFKDILSNEEINAVTAFLRSRASGWNVPKPSTVTVPLPANYVLNPTAQVPKFTLREGLYVSAEQLFKSMKDSLKMVVLDARSEVAWRQSHIPGSIPVPYYEEPENFIEDIPNDSTQIVVYCACPHAASQKVVNTLKRNGFKNMAILDEGVLVWAQLGYPVENGK